MHVRRAAEHPQRHVQRQGIARAAAIAVRSHDGGAGQRPGRSDELLDAFGEVAASLLTSMCIEIGNILESMDEDDVQLFRKAMRGVRRIESGDRH